MELEEALKKIEELNATNEELVTSVKKLETNNSKLVTEKRELEDKVKNGLTDEQAKAEIEKLQAMVASKDEEIKEVESSYVSQIAKKDMVTMLRDAGVEAPNQKAFEEIANIILDDAQYEDGSFKFLDEEGTTRYNEDNKPYSIIDKVNELKAGDDAFRFAQTTGGGKPDDTGTQAPKTTAGEVETLRNTFK